MGTVELTTACALVRFPAKQYVERDGVEQRFFAGCFGILGHGNVAGVGQALQQYAHDLTHYQARHEQGMVHAAGYVETPEQERGAWGVAGTAIAGAV